MLLAACKGELTEAHWSEFDWNNKNQFLLEERSKSGVGNIIPLSPFAIDIWKN